MTRSNYTLSGLTFLLAVAAASLSSRADGPDLTPGVWKNITPAGVTMTPTNHVFCQGVTLDPAHPSTIYLCVCAYDVEKGGLFKTTDGGATWARIGKLDEPLHLAVDPKDSKHLYCVDGVRGATEGFWVSNDGGDTWTSPPGFKAATQKPVGTQRPLLDRRRSHGFQARAGQLPFPLGQFQKLRCSGKQRRRQ